MIWLDGPYPMCFVAKGLIAEDEFKAAVAEYRDHRGKPVGGVVEWGAGRMVPCICDGRDNGLYTEPDYGCSYFRIASENESPNGQFFVTYLWPDKWVRNR